MLHNSESLTTTADCAANLLLDLAAVCLEAGSAIESVKTDDLGVEYKHDHSPLTKADLAAENVLGEFLQRYGIPIVSEEATPERLDARTMSQQAYWLVDPLDGTREFIAGRPHYTVNLALIYHDYPLLGLVYAPALRALYLGFNLGDADAGYQGIKRRAWTYEDRLPHAHQGIDKLEASRLQEINTKQGDAKHLHALVSASHLDARTASWVERHPVSQRSDVGSSLKFCKLAEGFADVYPRFAATMEWDTAAGQAVLEAAGGLVLDEQMKRFRYGKSGWRNTPFVAWGNPLFAPEGFIEHNPTGNRNIQTGDLAKHRQVHELIAGLANKTS
ncbi:MAG TPA: 3'(2'),5'-bisphosphate nucleotidase CysQ [Lautropia sp.]|nr:3'(2'),5'-bisphosphate nucleotidase CysQ [Lautropia sp.]